MADLFDSLFDPEDDDLETTDIYVVVASFRAQFSGVCNVDDRHAFRKNDIVGKLERADTPFITVGGVCCNRCVRTITHKKSVT